MFTLNGFPNLVYHFAENGDLFDYIKVSGALPLPVFKSYAVQILEAIRALHTADVCHMDIKLENIVLDSNFDIKLIDLGFACPVSGNYGSGYSYEFKGTENYISPEMYVGKKYSPIVADIFSLGVLLFILYTGVQPF